MVDEKSAGAIIFHSYADYVEYLLLHYTSGHWDFPKGNIEAGENEKQAAAREIREETGITDVEFLDGFHMKIEYKYRHDRRLVQKEVVLFLARTHTHQVTISHEHIGFAWRKFDDATQQLSFRNAKNLLSAAKDYLRHRSLAYR